MTPTQRKTDIEATKRRSLKQKNIHSVITKQKQQDIDTDVTLSTDCRNSCKFVSDTHTCIVHIDSYRKGVQFVKRLFVSARMDNLLSPEFPHG